MKKPWLIALVLSGATAFDIAEITCNDYTEQYESWAQWCNEVADGMTPSTHTVQDHSRLIIAQHDFYFLANNGSAHVR